MDGKISQKIRCDVDIFNLTTRAQSIYFLTILKKNLHSQPDMNTKSKQRI